jgi:hypothetical protein
MSKITERIINNQTFVFRNCGDGWDVYHAYGDVDDFHLNKLEEGCATFEEAIKIAEEYAYA